jgi:hypothetical protein
MARKPKPHIPQTADELDAAWFSQTLGPDHDGASVTAVDHARIGEGIGFIGELIRCRLTWDREDSSLPTSVVAKVPSSLTANRSLGEGLMAYEREIIVYRDLAPLIGLPMPAFFHGEMDPNPAPWALKVVAWLLDHLPLRGVSWMIDRLLNMPESALRRFLLVMEDIDDARPAQQFDGGSLDDAFPALEILASFHAEHWNDQALLEQEPLIWPIDRTPKVYQATYRKNRDSFLKRFDEQIEPAMIRHLDDVQENLIERTRELAKGPWTILHGDYRLDNILYRSTGELVVLDYQLVLWGRAGWDVGYFITTALGPEHRAHEESMLRHYHDALISHGVEDYSYDQLLADTRLTKDLLAHRLIGSGDTFDTQVAGRDDSFMDHLVRRVVGWVDLP